MKKQLLITISLISLNAYAFDPVGDEERYEYQRNQMQAEQQELRNQQTQMRIEQSNEMTREWEAGR